MLKTLFRGAITLVMLGAAIITAWLLWSHYMYSPWTRDGRVRADIIAVAPDVTGFVVAVPVRDNQSVRKGDVLFAVDPSRYRLALAQAEAALAMARTDAAIRRTEARRRALLGDQVVSSENRETTHSAAQAADARVRELEAALGLAQLNLERTEVRAPTDGFVTNLNVHPGDFAVAGKAMLAVVDRHTFRIEGYFEETKIPALRIGDAADIRLIGGGPHLTGTVVSLARAIAEPDIAGLLSNVNPTFHWVRLAQRIPVRIELTDIPEHVVLAAGMTCTVTIKPGERNNDKPRKEPKT